jgi:hypothetical protein
MQTDFTPELVTLLTLVTQIPASLALHSTPCPYSRSGRASEAAPDAYVIDMLWLQDSTHDFDQMSAAISEMDSAKLISCCDSYLDRYTAYQVGRQDTGVNVFLVELKTAWESIKNKALAA